jgi:hypothetical protein
MSDIRITATAGNGKSVHIAVPQSETMRAYTLCGAEGRGMRIFRVRPTSASATCKRCLRRGA